MRDWHENASYRCSGYDFWPAVAIPCGRKPPWKHARTQTDWVVLNKTGSQLVD